MSKLPQAVFTGLLDAVLDRLIPADADPGALALGTVDFVRRRLAGEGAPDVPSIVRGLEALAARAEHVHGCAFTDLAGADMDRLIAGFGAAAWLGRLAEIAAEGFYADPGNGGNAGAASWTMIGYEPRLPPRAAPRRSYAAHAEHVPDDILYDTVIVGAGAGGGIAACVLAEAGKRVLLLERGDDYDFDVSGLRDHLRNHRLSAYGHNTGPDLAGNPRVFVDSEGGEHIVAPHQKGYQSNAAGPGSGTKVYGAQAWRFHPDDFRMASRYGVPEGSSLADWPFSYADLAPDYERAEWQIGVAGGRAGMHAPMARDYPMPPAPGYAIRRVLAAGAAQLGLPTIAPPLAINTVPRDGRAACIECGSCVGFACPSDAKNGTQNTMIPRALATGHCDFVLRATVERIETDARGRVDGLSFRQGLAPDAPRRRVRARTVVLAAGAIETARLLLLSANAREPAGLGNAHDQVGRHLQGHIYPTAIGLFDDPVYDPRGPGVTIATTAFNHGNDSIVGGGMLADDFTVLPAIFWKTMLPPDLPRWGGAAKDFMRANYRRVTQIRGPVQEIPNPDSRVTLDVRVKDRFGLPVARLSGVCHPESIRTALFMRERAIEWMQAAGAKRIWSEAPQPRLSAGQHQAGTGRMGEDPRRSVTDGFGRIWGHENLVVADASLHVTNGGFNPVLTVMALAFRVSRQLAADL